VLLQAPTDSNLSSYLDYMKRKKVVTLVRACEPTYDKAPLEAAGIKVIELAFTDGLAPPEAVISTWLALVNQTFDEEKGSKKKDKKEAAAAPAAASAASNGKSGSSKSSSDFKCAIAVHCVAGLGRAPVLVCLALIESGMGWMEAVELVRKKRRGALNLTQLKYLETYKVRGKKDSCTIM
jgi:protein tyrosine phosphatase type 4A